MHFRFKYPPLRIHQPVALAALNLLGPLLPLTAHPGRLDALTIVDIGLGWVSRPRPTRMCSRPLALSCSQSSVLRQTHQ